MYKNISEFKTLLEKYKLFRELPEQYKSIKFCKLYMRMYQYMLSIPKDKIVVKTIFSEGYIGRRGLLGFVKYFIEAKDFYKWKERIYFLLTEKLSTTNSIRKFELHYRSKAKEFFNQYLEKQKSTFRKIYNTNHPMQSKEVQDKASNTWQNKTKEEIRNIVEKRKITNLGIYGKENPMQSKEIQDKIKATNLERYGEEWYVMTDKFGKNSSNHSKIGDDMCKSLDIIMGTKNSDYTHYATKNGELSIKKEDDHFFKYDYANTLYKFVVEFQGLYSHGLLEGQEYSYGRPVEEVWKYDEEKKILAEQNGYKVFYVYEDEYRNNKSKCLENLLKEIKEYVHSKNNMI